MYFLAIRDNLLSAHLFLCCFFKSNFHFQIDVQIHPRLLKIKLIILLVCNKVQPLTVKQKETLHQLTLGFHVTQIKFVTRILFILHKSSMMPTIPAELPMHLELIQKLLMFVSHMYIVVMHLNSKAKVHFDMSNWYFPYIVLLQYKNIFKILPDCFSSCLKKRTTTQFFILQAINTIHHEKCDENFTSAHAGSCKPWQKPQLLL